MTTASLIGPRAALATRRGTRTYNMDAGAIFRATNGIVAGAVVDGIDNDRHGAQTMRLIAHTAARIGATRGALAGVLAAAALIDDPGTADYRPDGVLVLALMQPGQPTELGWVGDSHIFGWDGHTLHRRSDPHTMGEYLRQNGEPEQLAVQHDNWIRVRLSTATPTTVALAEAPGDELLLLVSDGLDAVPADKLAALVAQHQHDPKALAFAMVATPRVDLGSGYRDDATALVLLPGNHNHLTTDRKPSA